MIYLHQVPVSRLLFHWRNRNKQGAKMPVDVRHLGERGGNTGRGR